MGEEAAETLTREMRLEDLFDACDDDGSGALSMDEFAQIFDDKVTKAEVGDALKDIDKDQVDGKLTKSEFVQYHLKKFEVLDDGTFAKIMDALITKAEDADVIDDEPAVVDEPATEEAAAELEAEAPPEPAAEPEPEPAAEADAPPEPAAEPEPEPAAEADAPPEPAAE